MMAVIGMTLVRLRYFLGHPTGLTPHLHLTDDQASLLYSCVALRLRQTESMTLEEIDLAVVVLDFCLSLEACSARL
jgi:hypothetical protein